MSGYKDLESGGARGNSALVNEIVGTFFLSLALFAGVDGWNALATGGMLAFLTWFGNSGDFNAAVTVSNMVGKDPSASIKGGALAIVGQIVGALLATLFAGFLAGGAPGNASGGDTASALNDILLTLVLLFVYNGRDASPTGKGFGYFSGLAAFSSTFGANASVVLGVLLGNAALGGGLALGNGVIYGAGAPLVAGVVFPFLGDVLGKIPRADELLGTLFFALMSFAIGSGNPFALGTTLHTLSNVWSGAFNPAVTVANWVKAGINPNTIADPVIDIAVQTVGATLAVVAGSFAGVSAGIPDAAAVGPPALLELIFALIFTSVYLKGGDTLTKGLTYFACVVSFASSFNPALPLGLYLGGLAGFGGGALALSSVLGPILGGAVGGFLSGKFGEYNEVLATAFLFLTIGSNAPSTELGGLALGAMVVALTTVYGASMNPALTMSSGGASPANIKTAGFQVVGATLGALLAQYAGVAGGAAVSAGLPGDINGAVAELFLAIFLIKVGGDGIKYFALLAVFGATAGSIANPATVLGDYVGGLVLGGNAFDVNALIGVVGHVAVPIVGALFGKLFWDNIPSKIPFSAAQLDGDEVMGSFFIVVGAAGVAGSGTASAALAYGVTLYTLFGIYNVDGIPLVSAYNKLGKGQDVVGFLKKLAAQTIGALLAAYTSGFLVGGDVAGSAGGELADTLRNGILLAAVLAWGLTFAQGAWGTVLSYFVAATLFTGVNLNSAADLGVAVQGAIGGDVSAFTDTAWLAAFFAPILGGIIAGRVEPFLGK